MKKDIRRAILFVAVALAGCGGEPERSKVVQRSETADPVVQPKPGKATDAGKIPMH
jgi:hypothetical protein